MRILKSVTFSILIVSPFEFVSYSKQRHISYHLLGIKSHKSKMKVLILIFVSLCLSLSYSANDTNVESNSSSSNSAYHESKRQRESVIKQTLRAGSTESCDLLKDPLGVLRGETCGSHYKVLGINRKKSPVDKSTLRKAYHKLSLSTHPDKHGGKDSEAAFTLVQSAYDCLSDPDCQREYNYKLDSIEEDIQYRRKVIQERVTEEVKMVANFIREGAVSTSSLVVKIADDLASRLEWRVQIMDWTVDAGAWIASSILFIFCRPVMYALMLSRGILHVNAMAEERWPQLRSRRWTYQRSSFY